MKIHILYTVAIVLLFTGTVNAQLVLSSVDTPNKNVTAPSSIQMKSGYRVTAQSGTKYHAFIDSNGDGIPDQAESSGGGSGNEGGEGLQYFADTKGELSVTGMGSANYLVPVALPPGIKNIAPQVALTYNSSSDNSMAGYGWNITGISSISRVSSRLDLEGHIEGVNFTSTDRFSLDGQRLLLSSGTYGAAGSAYKTENQSNLKIEALGSVTYPGIEGTRPEYFRVTFPDGVQVFYGSSSDARGVTEWLIKKWKDPQGNYIEYFYEKDRNTTYISKIVWAVNENQNTGYSNTIQFYYKQRLRPEFAYVHGVKMVNNKILDRIEVLTGGQLFRKYQLTHQTITGNYQRVASVQEFNGANEPANPVVFTYDTTPNVFDTSYDYDKSEALWDLKNIKLTGDFDGDGETDVVVGNSLYKGLMTNLGKGDSKIPITVQGTLTDIPVISVDQGKIGQTQSLLTLQAEGFTKNAPDHNLKFRTYAYKNGSFVKNQKDRVVKFPHANHKYDECRPSSSLPIIDEYSLSNDFKYIEGDFNGDGISEIIFINRVFTDLSLLSSGSNYKYPPEIGPGDPGPGTGGGVRCIRYEKSYANISYYVDLNSEIEDSKSYKVVSRIKDNNYVIDFNGDGKSDILSLENYGFFEVLSLGANKEFKTLYQGSIPEYDGKKPLLIGDFNGDGKSDLLIPEAEGSHNWLMYISTGKGFEKVRYDNLVEYLPVWQGSGETKRRRVKNYILADLNKDGKSDFILSVYESYGNSWDSSRNGKANIQYFENLGGADKPVFAPAMEHGLWSRYGYDDAITLTIADYTKNEKTGNFVFTQGNEIWRGKFNKDLRKDLLLTKVTEIGGNQVSSLEYTSLEPNAANNGLGDASGTYFSSGTETYPYKEIIRIPNMDIVKKVSVTTAGKTLYQQYKYFGLTTHTRGLGLLGFKKTARSNWMTAENIVKAEIWSVSEMYPRLGRTGELFSPYISSWTFKGNNYNLITNPQDNQLLSKKSVRFLTTEPSPGVHSNLLNHQIEKDFITGTTVTTDNQYHDYHNLTRSIVNNGVSTVQTDYTYINNPSGSGAQYYIGRLAQTRTSVTAYNDTYTTEEKYAYTGNLVTQTQKKGHDTDYITESLVYDGFGNLVQKTVSAPGAASRTIKDEYDSTGRFVKKKTDVDNLTEQFVYNNQGQVLTHTSPLQTVTRTVYDAWGKVRQITLSGTSETPLVTYTDYERTKEAGVKITSYSNQTGEYSVLYKDIWGRGIKTTTKGFAPGTYISKDIVYDVLGRKVKESEPYFEGSGAAYWNTLEYDDLSRPVKQTLFTGKIITNTYNGLSVTTNDGVKKQTQTKDANGNTIRTEDNGELITYTYYANGGQKTSNYNGHIITTQQDGWGRRISLHDPAVSTVPYTYTYTNYGEIETEVTPKGTTRYSYTPTGKLSQKTIQGDHTNLQVTYTYSDKGLLLVEDGYRKGDILGEPFSVFEYEYDAYNRLVKKTEEQGLGIGAEKVFTYDALGRIQTESTRTEAYAGVESRVSITHHYNAYNGMPDKIIDTRTGKLIWEMTAANERMQALSAKLGNGISITNRIDGAGYVRQTDHSGTVSSPLAVSYDFDWKRGTLNSRSTYYYNWNEQFTYDGFDRLVSWSDPNGTHSNDYAPDGRITRNSQVGDYQYQPLSRYKKSSIDLNVSGKSYYENKPDQRITYNAFKAPVEITEGTNSVDFSYNFRGQRLSSYELGDYGRTKEISKSYSHDLGVEFIQDEISSTWKVFTYIGGDMYSALAVYSTEFSFSPTQGAVKTGEGYYYLHRDYQGTILAVTNEQGKVEERRLFDPWGKVLKVTDKNGNTQSANPEFIFTNRGYTGHEHYFSVGLIHMNGRMYDPVLQQFLSPDNFIQDPSNSQNYNRYGYVLNNPLMYTDPSGEAFEWAALGTAAIVGAIIGGTVYTAYALYTDTFSWGGFTKSVVMGGVSGAAAYGVGSLTGVIMQGSAGTLGQAMQSIHMVAAMEASTLGYQIGSALLGAGLHAISQGFITGVSGGDVMQGFSSGGISSMVASAVGLGGAAAGINGDKIAGTLFFGTISGGFGSVLTGGNFWQGAATGLIVSGLNHVAHSGNYDNGYEKDENGGYRQINNDGGDMFDILYGQNGQMLEITEVQIFKGQTLFGSGMGGNSARGYGKRFVQDSPAIADDSFSFLPIGKVFAGLKIMSFGLSKIPKSSVGFRAALGGSKGMLKSTYYFTQKLGVNTRIKNVYTPMFNRTQNLGVLLGRSTYVGGAFVIGNGIADFYVWNKFVRSY